MKNFNDSTLSTNDFWFCCRWLSIADFGSSFDFDFIIIRFKLSQMAKLRSAKIKLQFTSQNIWKILFILHLLFQLFF